MNIALILSGGVGTRLGEETPKQYIEVGGKPIITYCLETCAGHEQIDAIQIVADEDWQDFLKDELKKVGVESKFHGFSIPGENRQLSILNGLEDIRQYAHSEDVVLIHDAARPLLAAEEIDSCLSGIVGHDGVMPVLPMKDTVYYSEDGVAVTSLLERSCVYAGQAPEAFYLEKYWEANQRLFPDQILTIHGSTEPAIMAGLDVAMIPGDEGNFKITTAEDLARFREMAVRAAKHESI